MDLAVMLGDPAVVDGQELRPTPRAGEIPVGKPPLDLEVSFRIGLASLATGDLVLDHTEAIEDGQQVLGAEDPAAIGDQGRGRCCFVAMKKFISEGVEVEILRA